MKKELFKTITLILLIAISILLFYQIWFSEKLWSDDYNFFTINRGNFLKSLGISDNTETITVAIEDIIMPKRLVITGSGKRYIAIKGSVEYAECYSAVVKVLGKMDISSRKAITVDSSQWYAALKSRSILLDFGSVYSTDLLEKINLLLPGNAIKDIVLTPGDTVIPKPIIYIKDYLTEEIFKITIDTSDIDIVNTIQDYVSGENVKNMPFAFELGFDKNRQGNIAKNILLDSNIIIGLKNESIPSIEMSIPDSLINISNNSLLMDNILKLFDLNKNSTKRYIEKNDALVFIDKNATLKIFPDGLLEYTSENGGISLYSDSTDNKDATAQSISNIYSLVRNVMRFCNVSEPQLQISSDLYGFSKQNFTTTLNIDYYINGMPAMISQQSSMIHPVSIKIEDGKIVSYRQYIYNLSTTENILHLSSTLKAVDNLYLKLSNTEIIVSDIYTSYLSDIQGNVHIVWCAKLKETDKIYVID